MGDKTLELLREARAELLAERDDEKKGSRELSVALTHIDTAILWREKDLQCKVPSGGAES